MKLAPRMRGGRQVCYDTMAPVMDKSSMLYFQFIGEILSLVIIIFVLNPTGVYR